MEIHIGVGASSESDEITAVREALRQARLKIPSERIDLAIIFTTINFSYSSILKTISLYLKDTPLIGCSGAAVISHKGIFKHGIVIMLLNIPEGVYFNTASVTDIKAKGALNAGEELGEKLLYGFQGVRRDFGITFSDGLIDETSNFIFGLQEKLGKSFPLAGASASDDLLFKKTYVYYNQNVMNDAACGLLWGGKLNFGLGVKHGWKPLGKPRHVTKSNDNVVHEIDGYAAANIYKDYLASDLENLKKEIKRISILYPIGIYLSGEEEYLLRNLLAIRDDGSLVLQGNVPEGSQIRLMIGTKESCLLATHQAIEEVMLGLGARKINLLLVFDSVSRYILLGRRAEEELKIIRKTLGEDTQIAGLYTFGEQAPLRAINYQGVTRLHNQTITLVGIGG